MAIQWLNKLPPVMGNREIDFIIQITILAILAFAVAAVIKFAVQSLLLMLLENGKNRMARNWPCTEGTVIHSGIIFNHFSEACGTTLTNDTVYEYIVNGKKHISGNTQFLRNPVYGNEKDCQGFVNKYPVGQSVKVYYNPGNPDESVLFILPDTSAVSVLIGFTGLFLLLVGVSLDLCSSILYGHIIYLRLPAIGIIFILEMILVRKWVTKSKTELVSRQDAASANGNGH
jgi:hypothetical protein